MSNVVVGLEGFGGYKGPHHDQFGPQNIGRLTDGISDPFLDRPKNGVRCVGDVVRETPGAEWNYFAEYETNAAEDFIRSRFTGNSASGADRLLIVGFSCGAAAATDLAHRLRHRGVKISAVITIDPVRQKPFQSPLHLSMSSNASAWINFFQRGDKNFLHILRGNQVHGATNIPLTVMNFDSASDYANAHRHGLIATHPLVLDAVGACLGLMSKS